MLKTITTVLVPESVRARANGKSIGRTCGVIGAVAIVSLTAAGCGGAKSASPPASTSAAPAAAHAATLTSRYERQMQALGARLESSLQLAGDIELASAGKKGAGLKDSKALENAQVALRSAANELAQIVPPPPIRSANALLLRGVKEYADELNQVIDALNAGGRPVVVLQEIFKLKGVKDMQRASLQIERKGYNITG